MDIQTHGTCKEEGKAFNAHFDRFSDIFQDISSVK